MSWNQVPSEIAVSKFKLQAILECTATLMNCFMLTKNNLTKQDIVELTSAHLGYIDPHQHIPIH